MNEYQELKNQWGKMLYRGIMPMFEILIFNNKYKENDYLLVDISLHKDHLYYSNELLDYRQEIEEGENILSKYLEQGYEEIIDYIVMSDNFELRN